VKRKKGQSGRNKLYGKKISLPRRSLHLEKFEEKEMIVYGKKQKVYLRKLDCYWYFGKRSSVSSDSCRDREESVVLLTILHTGE
jgi:hypothetical protein